MRGLNVIVQNIYYGEPQHNENSLFSEFSTDFRHRRSQRRILKLTNKKYRYYLHYIRNIYQFEFEFE